MVHIEVPLDITLVNDQRLEVDIEAVNNKLVLNMVTVDIQYLKVA